MTCSQCQRANRAERRFCGGCGSSLTVACNGCGFINDVSDRFCGGCSIPLPTAAAVRLPEATVAMLSLADVEALIAESPAVSARAVSLPEGPIGQDDLDRLFGAE